MRVLLLLAVLPLAGCGSDFWDQPATPAPSGVSATHNGLDPRGLGAEPVFGAKGSQATFGRAVRSY